MNVGRVGRNAFWTCIYIPTFRRNAPSPSSEPYKFTLTCGSPSSTCNHVVTAVMSTFTNQYPHKSRLMGPKKSKSKGAESTVALEEQLVRRAVMVSRCHRAYTQHVTVSPSELLLLCCPLHSDKRTHLSPPYF